MTIKVNEKVFAKLKEVEDKEVQFVREKNYGRLVYHFLFQVGCLIGGTEPWLIENNITVADIDHAFRYGYELGHTFKKGDIVMIPQLFGPPLYREVEKMSPCGNIVYFFKMGDTCIENVKLICKAENKETK